MNQTGYRRLHISTAGFGRRILLPLFVCLLFSAQGCALLHSPENGDGQSMFFRAGNTERTVTADNPAGQTEAGRRDMADLSGHSGDPEAAGQAAGAGTDSPEKESAPKEETAAAAGADPDICGYVHVYGAVAEQGVYGIYSGMRLYELIEAAGGFTAQADENWLNLAAAVADGEQIHVPTRTEASQLRRQEIPEQEKNLSGVSSDSLQKQEGPDARVNINTASLTELTTLPGIGQTRAEAILKYRETQGPFRAVEEICNVTGIKQATFEKLKDLITV